MTKRAESKYKIDRRMGENIWGRPKSPVNKREYGPGQHGQRRKGKLSDFGTQLKAKQKLKGYYGNISERQFRKYYAEAIRMKGDSGDNLIGLLERRLDAVCYRAKFVPTVFAARQFVSHGHVLVNGKRVNIPSYQVKVGDKVEVRERSKQLAIVLEQRCMVDRFEAQFVRCIGCVRDQFAQEDFLVGVQRMDHQLQQLTGLGLEFSCFDLLAHGADDNPARLRRGKPRSPRASAPNPLSRTSRPGRAAARRSS